MLVKKIAACLFSYAILIAMIALTLLRPGQQEGGQPAFLHSFSLLMVIVGSLWVARSTIMTILAPWYTARLSNYSCLERRGGPGFDSKNDPCQFLPSP